MPNPLNKNGSQRYADRSDYHTKGFSLIELLVVIAIIVALTGLATVGFVQSFQSRSIEHFVKGFVSYLRFVQFKSIEEGSIHKLVFSAEDGTVSAFVQEKPGGDFLPLKDLFSKQISWEKRYETRLAQGKELYFFPDGVIDRNKLSIMDQDKEIAVIEIKNRIGTFRITMKD